MTPAILGLNGSLNLVVSLLLISLVFMWGGLIYRAFTDAERRIEDPVLVRVMPAWSIFPFLGYLIYMIIRPPEYIDDAREREVETRAAEARLAMLQNRTCRNCGYEVESTYLRCPSCLRKLKEPCETCNKPLDPRWRVCPFCETEVKRAVQAQQPARRGRATRAPAAGKSADPRRAAPRTRPAAKSRDVPSAAERQRRSLTDEAKPASSRKPSAEAGPEAPERLSASAAIAPSRGEVKDADGKDVKPGTRTSSNSKNSEEPAKRPARSSSGSKKTSGGRAPRSKQ